MYSTDIATDITDYITHSILLYLVISKQSKRSNCQRWARKYLVNQDQIRERCVVDLCERSVHLFAAHHRTRCRSQTNPGAALCGRIIHVELYRVLRYSADSQPLSVARCSDKVFVGGM